MYVKQYRIDKTKQLKHFHYKLTPALVQGLQVVKSTSEFCVQIPVAYLKFDRFFTII